jgi:hypothetical protein
LVFALSPLSTERLELTIYRTRGEHANHYITWPLRYKCGDTSFFSIETSELFSILELCYYDIISESIYLRGNW